MQITAAVILAILMPALAIGRPGMAKASSTTPPEWFTTGRHPRWVQEFYITGAGSGETFEAAMVKAQAQIARQIEVRIQSEVTSVITSYVEDDREQIGSTFESIGRSVAEASLKGVQVAEKALEGDTYYLFLALDRDKYTEGIRSELGQIRSQIQKQYDDSETLLSGGDVFRALEILMDTEDAAAQFFARAVLSASLTGEAYPTSDVISGPAILSRARTVLSRVSLQRVSGDGQSGKIGVPLPEPFVVMAEYEVSSGKVVPMADVRLSLRDEDNDVLDRQYTCVKGKASFRTCAIGKDKGKATVSLDLAQLPAVLKRDLKRMQVTFKYDVLSVEPMSFSVEVFDGAGGRVGVMERTVIRSVESAGHSVSAEAPLLLTGRLQQLESQQVEGIGGPQYMVRTELTLFVKEKSSGEKVGSIALTATGLDKSSEKAAALKSYKKFTISRNKMSKMLAEAGDKLEQMNDE